MKLATSTYLSQSAAPGGGVGVETWRSGEKEKLMKSRPHKTCGLCQLQSEVMRDSMMKKQRGLDQMSKLNHIDGQGASKELGSRIDSAVASGCGQHCNCSCHSMHDSHHLSSSGQMPGMVPGDFKYNLDLSKLPPTAQALSNPHGSSQFLLSYRTPAPNSEYKDSYIPPKMAGLTNRMSQSALTTLSNNNSQLYSDKFRTDALTSKMEVNSRIGKEHLPSREKDLYPINDPNHVKHRYHPAVFERYEDIPEEVRSSKRYYISKDWSKKFHVYDMGYSEERKKF